MSDRKDDKRGFKAIEVRGLDGTTYKAFSLPTRPEADGEFKEVLGEFGEESTFTPLFPEGGKPQEGGVKDAAQPTAAEAPQVPEPAEDDPDREVRAAEEARLRQIEQAAHDAGFESGEVAGMEAGRMAGEEKGFGEGFARGEKEGLEAGFAKGEIDGFEAAKKEAETRLEALTRLMGGLDDLWTRLIRANEEKIVELVGRVAEKVVGERIETDNEVVKRAILSAFEIIPEPVDVTIRVSPEDYEYIEIVKEDFFREIKELKQVSVVSDPAVSRGGCRIETAAGEVDATIESRLSAVVASLKSRY